MLVVIRINDFTVDIPVVDVVVELTVYKRIFCQKQGIAIVIFSKDAPFYWLNFEVHGISFCIPAAVASIVINKRTRFFNLCFIYCDIFFFD